MVAVLEKNVHRIPLFSSGLPQSDPIQVSLQEEERKGEEGDPRKEIGTQKNRMSCLCLIR